jgi:hypothetical protein
MPESTLIHLRFGFRLSIWMSESPHVSYEVQGEGQRMRGICFDLSGLG